MTDRFVFAPKQRVAAVLETIESARRHLLLSLFRCDDFRVLDALGAALQRGVKVSVLITPRAKGWTRRLDELWQILEGMGASLCRYADPVVKYHAKYIVADDARALVASLNFTRKCFERTCDFLLVTRDPAVVKGLTRLFAADCHGKAVPLSSRAARLIVGPEEARHRLTGMLKGGRRSIYIVDPKVTDPAMLDLLKAKRAAGVDVRVLGRQGLGGKYDPHGKMLLVDGKVGVIGSLSLSALSLDFRREVAVVVRDRARVAEMEAVFRALAGPQGRARTAAVSPRAAGGGVLTPRGRRSSRGEA